MDSLLKAIFGDVRRIERRGEELTRQCLRGWYESVRASLPAPTHVAAFRGSELRTREVEDHMWLVEILVDGQWQALIYSDDQGNWSHPNLRDMHAELRSAGYTTPAFISPFPGLSHCEIDVLHSADAWVLLPVYLGALLRVKARRSFGLCIVAAARVEEQAPALGSEPEETPEEPSSEAAEASPSRKRRKRRSQNSNSPESHE